MGATRMMCQDYDAIERALIGLDFVVLNVLLIVIDLYCVSNSITNTHWYLKMALPIVSAIYLILNILLSVRFLPINKLLKTSIILTTIDIIIYIILLYIFYFYMFVI